MRSAWWVVLVALVGCRGSESRHEVPSYYEIGVVHRTVSTESADAQLWFDRGLALTFAFNHEEAIRCFEKAAAADPGCAMPYWGKAYALGPNYNNPAMTPAQDAAACEALEAALARLDRCTEAERDLITALGARYACPAPGPADRMPLEQGYAEAMRGVQRAHPDDADVAALTAEALMMLRPWKLWTLEGTPAPETPEIVAVLEAARARWPDHPALCHLLIHAVEASPTPERGLPAAQRLETLVPGAGHLVHMPAHIYLWMGRYPDMIRVNEVAVVKDLAFVAHAGRDNFFTLYRLHNYHFIAYGSMFEGRRQRALSAARELVSEIPPSARSNMIDLVDVFHATPYHVMVRFGMWTDMLTEPEPAAELLAARAVWHYARGIALASLSRVDEASAEQAAFLRAKAAVPETRLLFQNQVVRILEVAELVLAGEIEYRRGHLDRAFALLEQAVERDLHLAYDEPWGWTEPTRHALGALLTEQGRYREAEAVYRADLERFSDNGWSLHGLAECLNRTDRVAEAVAVEARFKKAWARADVEIPGSCFCRTR